MIEELNLELSKITGKIAGISGKRVVIRHS